MNRDELIEAFAGFPARLAAALRPLRGWPRTRPHGIPKPPVIRPRMAGGGRFGGASPGGVTSCLASPPVAQRRLGSRAYSSDG